MPRSRPRAVRSFEHDLAAPIFAISYPWTRAQDRAAHFKIQFVRRLFDQLESSVSELVGAEPGQKIGFLDRDDMTGGQDPWPAVVREAFAKSQVLVPLLTPGYPKSTWCEREWQLFASRRTFDKATRRPTPQNKSILPVLWIPGGSMPSYISSVARFSPTDMPRSIEERYLDEGLYGLAQLVPEDLDPVAWRLARRITDCFNRTWTEPVEIDDLPGVTDDQADPEDAQ